MKDFLKDNSITGLELRHSLIRCWAHANPKADVESRKSQLIDFLVREFPQITRGGHRGLVNRMDVWNSCEHECPKCHEHHIGMETILDNCGIRFLPNRGEIIDLETKEREGRFYFQSWCGACRGKGERKDPSDPTFGKRVNAANPDVVVFTN